MFGLSAWLDIDNGWHELFYLNRAIDPLCTFKTTRGRMFGSITMFFKIEKHIEYKLKNGCILQNNTVGEEDSESDFED